jgi:isoleucyl-tRNA synthetase
VQEATACSNDEILTPVQGDGVFAASLPFFGGMFIWKANPVIVDKLAEVGACSPAARSPTATCTAGATRRR